MVVEKPFGKDLASSEALANDISKHYSEEQVCFPSRTATMSSACLVFRTPHMSRMPATFGTVLIEKIISMAEHLVQIFDAILVGEFAAGPII